MKKFLIILTLLFLISPVFAKTVQCVKKYQVAYETKYGCETLDVTPQIQSMLDVRWRVVSITPITKKDYNSSPTDYVIVVFEREE